MRRASQDDPNALAGIAGGAARCLKCTIDNNSAVSRQFGLPPERRSRLVSDGLLGLLTLKRLPTLDESQPKCPVARIARRSGKPAAFIGTPPKLFYTHFNLPADRPVPLESGA